MADFNYKLRNGKTLTLKGESQPSDEEVETYARQQKVELAPKDDESEGMMSKLYRKATAPLTDLPSRFARGVSDFITTPDSNMGDDFLSQGVARTRGFLGGAIEGIGDLASGLSSPLNIATAGLTGAGALSSLPKNVSKIAQIGGRMLSAPVAAHGGMQMIDPDSSMAERGMGAVELAGGIAGMRAPHANSVDIQAKPYLTREELNLSPNIVEKQMTPAMQASDDVFDSMRTGVPPEVPEPPRYGNTLAAKNASGLSYEELNSGLPNKTPEQMTAEAMAEFGAIKTEIRKRSADQLRESANNTGKPRYRLDNESGTGIPIDQDGIQIGSAVMPGRQLDPEMAAASRFSKNGKQPLIKDLKLREEEKVSTAQKVYDLSRGLMSVDMPYVTSAAFRQASPLAFTKDWFKSWVPSAKAYGSDVAYQAQMAEINKRPLFAPRSEPIIDNKTGQPRFDKDTMRPLHKAKVSIAEEAGLRLTDLGRFSSREEVLRGSLAEKIPLYGKHIAASNRAYTGFLNNLRASKFESLIDMAEREGLGPKNNHVLMKEIAEFVNTATGAGKIGVEAKFKLPGGKTVGASGDLEKYSKGLANVFFSPRKIASEVRMLNPSTYIMANPFVRKQYTHAVLRRMANWWTIAGVAQLGGAAVSKDPTNPDFGKIRIGNTRIDPPGGMQQFLVLAAQNLAGGKTSSTGKPGAEGKFSQFGEGFKPNTITSNTTNFAINRMHPTARFAYDLMNATKTTPVGVVDRTLQLAAPMFTNDLMEVLNEDPALAALITGASNVGMGTQTYGAKDFGKPQFVNQKNDFLIGR